MKVWIVNEVTDFEYGYTEIVAVFSSKEKAEEYLNDNNSEWDPWYAEPGHTYETLNITEWKVE